MDSGTQKDVSSLQFVGYEKVETNDYSRDASRNNKDVRHYKKGRQIF